MSKLPQEQQKQLLPQAYLTNFHNRIRNEEVSMFVTAQPTRGHKRAKVVNYAEVDPDIFDELAGTGRSRNNYYDSKKTGGNDHNGNAKSFGGSGMSKGQDELGVKDFNSNDVNINGGNKDSNGNEDGSNGTGNEDGKVSREEYLAKSMLPDIIAQDEPMSILRYSKIRETFLQSKIATPYRLDIPPNISVDQQEPIVIPISLNLEHNGHSITDTFTWNVNDHSITPEEFATIYCRDLDFANSNSLQQQIISAINDQITEHETVAAVVVPDLHVVINLTCNLEDKFYEDNFQWNLNDKSFSPELFAELVVQDLGLTREYIAVISHSLHEYLLKVKREWLEGHLNQDHVPNGSAFGYLSGIRLDLDGLGAEWCPKVEVLTPEEIQRREIEKERNLRRLKRESDRMGRRGRRRMDDLETTMRI